MLADVKTTIWGISLEGWTALATVVAAFANCLLVAIAAWQISAIRNETNKSRTLDACNRYDTDPVVHTCLQRLKAAQTPAGGFNSYPGDKTDASTVLNVLDAVAIGI